MISSFSSFRASARPLAPASVPLRHHQGSATTRPVATRAAAEEPQSSSSSNNDSNNDEVAAAFARRIAADPTLAPPPRAPSPLLSPTTVSRAVCSALQRPDSPEVGSGARVAFDFTLPLDVAPAAPVLAGAGRKARSWHANETFLNFDPFVADSLSSPPCDVFENCESWELVGELTFTGRGSVSGIGDCSKAAQAVSVTAAAREGRGGEKGNENGDADDDEARTTRKYTTTILLTRVDDPGPWRGCWLVYGMRSGNYCTL